MTKRSSSQTGQKTTRNRASSRASSKGTTKSSSRSKNSDLLELGPEDDDSLLELEGGAKQKASIKVVGVGGGGGNALNTMIASGISGVQFIAANTDSQALGHNQAPIKIQLGAEVTMVVKITCGFILSQMQHKFRRVVVGLPVISLIN